MPVRHTDRQTITAEEAEAAIRARVGRTVSEGIREAAGRPRLGAMLEQTRARLAGKRRRRLPGIRANDEGSAA